MRTLVLLPCKGRARANSCQALARATSSGLLIIGVVRHAYLAGACRPPWKMVACRGGPAHVGGLNQQSMRVAQEAAGVFGELRDVVSLRVEAPRPVDVSPECANMLERLCLAQVRSCSLSWGLHR